MTHTAPLHPFVSLHVSGDTTPPPDGTTHLVHLHEPGPCPAWLNHWKGTLIRVPLNDSPHASPDWPDFPPPTLAQVEHLHQALLALPDGAAVQLQCGFGRSRSPFALALLLSGRTPGLSDQTLIRAVLEIQPAACPNLRLRRLLDLHQRRHARTRWPVQD